MYIYKKIASRSNSYRLSNQETDHQIGDIPLGNVRPEITYDDSVPLLAITQFLR